MSYEAAARVLGNLQSTRPSEPGRVIGWNLLDPEPKRNERIVTAQQLRDGWYMRIGEVVFRTSYRIISRLESGNYLVEDPKRVGGLGEFSMYEKEEKC